LISKIGKVHPKATASRKWEADFVYPNPDKAAALPKPLRYQAGTEKGLFQE
jgi:hypothetical protein